MSLETAPRATATGSHPEPSTGLVWLIRDSWTEALRHLRAMPRSPELLVFAAIQPIMFVVLFVYVFGGAIEVPGYTDYKQYLLPGIFAQTVLFGSAFTGVGIAEDLTKGFVDRLRSLPISGSTVLIGRTLSDTVRNLVTYVVMIGVAFVVGFRIDGSLGAALVATALLLSYGYAFSWIQAWVGLSVKTVEAANSGGFIWMFPLTFVSSAFVDPASMPAWVARIAEANPFTTLTDATRALFNGRDPGPDVLVSFGWAIGLTVVFASLSFRKFTSAANR